MRATLNIPDDLVSEVQKVTGEKSKTKAIAIAMKEFIRQKKIKQLIALRGKVHIDYDWEKAKKYFDEIYEKNGKSWSLAILVGDNEIAHLNKPKGAQTMEKMSSVVVPSYFEKNIKNLRVVLYTHIFSLREPDMKK